MADDEDKSPIPIQNPYEGVIGRLMGMGEQCVPNLNDNAKRKFSLRFAALVIQTAVPDRVRRELADTCRYMCTLDQGRGKERRPQPIIQENPELLIGEALDTKLDALIRSVTKKSSKEYSIRSQFNAAKKSLVNLKLPVDEIRRRGLDKPGPDISGR